MNPRSYKVPSHPGVEPGTSGLEALRAIHCANGTWLSRKGLYIFSNTWFWFRNPANTGFVTLHLKLICFVCLAWHSLTAQRRSENELFSLHSFSFSLSLSHLSFSTPPPQILCVPLMNEGTLTTPTPKCHLYWSFLLGVGKQFFRFWI